MKNTATSTHFRLRAGAEARKEAIASLISFEGQTQTLDPIQTLGPDHCPGLVRDPSHARDPGPTDLCHPPTQTLSMSTTHPATPPIPMLTHPQGDREHPPSPGRDRRLRSHLSVKTRNSSAIEDLALPSPPFFSTRPSYVPPFPGVVSLDLRGRSISCT